jgi:hypothetical protein
MVEVYAIGSKICCIVLREFSWAVVAVVVVVVHKRRDFPTIFLPHCGDETDRVTVLQGKRPSKKTNF